MDTQNATPNFVKYANKIKQIGPIIIGNISSATIKNGQGYYMGANQSPLIISDPTTYNSLFGITIDNPLNDFTLYIEGPAITTQGAATIIELSLSDLFFTINDAQSQGADVSKGININFQVMDVVGNGQIGKMIVFGSSLMPLANGSNGGTTGN